MEKLLLKNTNIIIKDALRQLDEAGEKILFIVSSNFKLLGALSDGDIRRHLLKNGSLNEPIEKIYNHSPIFIKEPYDVQQAKRLMLENKIEVIPVVKDDNRVIDILLWDNVIKESDNPTIRKNKINIPLVIMAGGRGTRLDPFTKILPKPLIPIGDKPIVEIIMDKFIEFGISEFFLTINYKGEMIKSYFDCIDNYYNITFISEDDFLGTAGSLKLLPDDISDNFMVSNCDIIVNADYSDVYNYHIKNDNYLTIIGSIQQFTIPYGVIKAGVNGMVTEINEKPEYDITINTGVYVLNKKALNFVPDNAFFHITDLIEILLENGHKVGSYPVSEKSYIDIGQWEEYHKAIDKLRIMD